jgi:hypothetical protein
LPPSPSCWRACARLTWTRRTTHEHNDPARTGKVPETEARHAYPRQLPRVAVCMPMLEAKFFLQHPEQRAILRLGVSEIDYPCWETIASWPF